MNRERKHTKEQIESALNDDFGHAYVSPWPENRELNLHPGDLCIEGEERSKFAAVMFAAKLLDRLDGNPTFTSLTAEFLHVAGDDLAQTFIAYKRYMDSTGYKGLEESHSPAVEQVMLGFDSFPSDEIDADRFESEKI